MKLQKFNEYLEDNNPSILMVAWSIAWRIALILFILNVILTFLSGKVDNTIIYHV